MCQRSAVSVISAILVDYRYYNAAATLQSINGSNYINYDRIHSRSDIAPSCCSAFNVRVLVISSIGTDLFLDASPTFSVATAQASFAVPAVV